MVAETQACYRHPGEETRIRCTRCERPICPACMHPAPVGHHCPTCVAEGRRQVRRPFRLPRPRSLTIVLLGVNVAMFVLELALGALRDLRVLVDMGALVPGLVAEGQWWRLLSAMFLHASLFHLLLNAYALFLFGTLVERSFGTLRLGAVYLVTGFAASASSYAFGGAISVGASGAIFGLLGAWLAFNLRRRNLAGARGNVQIALLMIGINLVLGFSLQGVDNAAHLGGLAAGLLAGFAAEGPGRPASRSAWAAGGLVLIAMLAAALVVWRTGSFA